MPVMPPLDKISKKWAAVAAQRASDYADGIKSPRVDWKEATAAAADNYAQGVTEAIAANRFSKGVNRAGTSKWQAMAIAKGPPRWTSGCQIAEPFYRSGFEPYHAALASLTLPPRYPRRDPRNLDRVRAIAEALAALKLQLG